MRVRYAYKVDGGNVPPHHQPHNVDINHDLDSGRITIGLNEDVSSKEEGEAKLFERYEFVQLKFVQSTSTKELNIVLKNEQPFQYNKLSLRGYETTRRS